MAQDWISLPDAICALSRLDGFDRGRAIELLIAMAKDMDLNSRMALEVNRSEGPPKQYVPMLDAHWLDLEQLDSDWINTGNAEWREEYQWRGIQISLDDMATYFPAIRRQFDENLQLVATGEQATIGKQKAVEELKDSDALLMPVPAALPEIGVVVRIEEALCHLAYGRPSFDTAVYVSSDGDMVLKMPDGSTYETGETGSEPAHLRALKEANQTLHRALQEGTLASYVTPSGGAPLSVSRIYWNGVNPELVHHLYRGFGPDERGAGCPLLLSRTAFETWRSDTLKNKKKGGDVPANRQLDHEKIISQVADMLRQQPGLSIGSAAASIVAELPPNRKTGKPRDTRNIERIIAHLWEGKVPKSPQ